MHTWQLQEAKSRFSELVDRSIAEGPQLVTRRGAEAVVVMAAPAYRRLLGQGETSLLAVLNGAPRGDPLDLDRSAESIRSLEL